MNKVEMKTSSNMAECRKAIERKIRNKERSIRRMKDKAMSIEGKLIALEEARIFCDYHKNEILNNRDREIKCSLNTYKNFYSWPKCVGGILGRGRFKYGKFLN